MSVPTSHREAYERALAERQRAHLEQLNSLILNWKPCLHDQCQNCHGTGVSQLGGFCAHGLVCDCPKCIQR